MAFPVKQKTWVISANVVLSGASLNAMMGSHLRAIADFLLANGYTCKGSSNGAAAAMDGVNRWGADADAQTRGANTTSVQSWMVLTDANGVDILLAYVGSADNQALFAYSPSGAYVAAGTATHTPTATDGLVLTAAGGSNAIGTTAASTNRTTYKWVSTDATQCRFTQVLRQSGASPTGFTWGVEELDTSLQERSISPSVWGFGYLEGEFNWGAGASSGINGLGLQGTRGGRMRVNNAINIDVNCGPPTFGNVNAGSFIHPWSNLITELQGSVGYPIWGPLRIGSLTAGMIGVAGELIDWWGCRFNNLNTAVFGDTYDSLNFMAVGASGGILWPWDGVTTPNPNGGAGPVVPSAQLGQHTGFEAPEAPYYGTFLNGASMYVPNANGNVTPTGPSAPKSINRRAGIDLIRLNTLPADPPAEVGRVVLYTRLIDGQQALFKRDPDGTVTMIGAGMA